MYEFVPRVARLAAAGAFFSLLSVGAASANEWKSNVHGYNDYGNCCQQDYDWDFDWNHSDCCYDDCYDRCDRVRHYNDDCYRPAVHGFYDKPHKVMLPRVPHVRGFHDSGFRPHVSSADVNANANTTVNSEINAFSANDVDIDQDGGWWGGQTADVDANANTDVNSVINALSSNDVDIDQ